MGRNYKALPLKKTTAQNRETVPSDRVLKNWRASWSGPCVRATRGPPRRGSLGVDSEKRKPCWLCSLTLGCSCHGLQSRSIWERWT